MYDTESYLVVGSGSFIAAGSIPPSEVSSGIVFMPRDGGWLFSGSWAVRSPNTKAFSSFQGGGGGGALLVSPYLNSTQFESPVFCNAAAVIKRTTTENPKEQSSMTNTLP